MQYTLTTSFINGYGWTASFDTRPEAIKEAFHFFGLAAPNHPTEEHALRLLKAVSEKSIGTFTITEITCK
tara:strand:- start:170 stop:379 length:210 start_codon:yes stop_codon:yes gene_type:complete